MGDIIRRGTTWYVRYRDADGVRRMRASHQPTRELARRFLLEIEARIARGQVGIPEPVSLAPKVAELVERFLTEYRQPKIKDLEKYRRFATSALRRSLPTLGALRADEVGTTHLDRLRDALASSCAPGSAGLTFTFLKTMFAWATRIGVIAANPLHRVQMPQPRETDVDYLSRDEVTALLTAVDRQAEAGGVNEKLLRGAVFLAIHAGLRKGELFGLRWRDLDLKNKRLTVRCSFATTTKGGKARHLRIPAAVVPILNEWAGQCPLTPEGLVFPQCHAGVWGMFTTTCAMLGLPALLARAGCRPITRAWHALRHTFASHYMMSGGNLLALQKILGHSDIKMTMIYAHLAPDFLDGEMDRLKFRPQDEPQEM